MSTIPHSASPSSGRRETLAGVRVRRTLLGSVSVAVARAAPTPLIVVPRGAEPGS